MRRTQQLFLSLLIGLVLTIPAFAQKVVESEAEYEGELPPLIDRQTFFDSPRYANARISPDGEYISFLKKHKGRMNIWVKGMDESFEDARPITAETDRPIRHYFWSQNGGFLLYLQDQGGNENYHLYAVDPDSEEETEHGVPPARDLTPYERVQARIISIPEKTPGKIIVGLNDRNPKYHDAYQIDLESGERTLLHQNNSGVTEWITDLNGNLRLAKRNTSDGGTEILRVENGSLERVYKCSFEETCAPVRFHKDNKRVYMKTNRGESDLTELVLLDPKSGKTERVEKDPLNKVDFGGAIFSEKTEELIATYYLDERKRLYPKSDAFRRDYRYLQKKFDGELSFRSTTDDGTHQIVTVSSDVDPGSVYLFNREKRKLTKLYSSRPELPMKHLAKMKAIEYEARDGTMIPAYLTLPKGVEAKNLPVVVYPHGGPWYRDTWGYNPYAQFLANRGYAVFQPNFRGSTGYGQKYLNAGNKQWGTGIMQHDITDGVQYLIDQGIADPERIGIYGISYGGYATLAGLTFTPDLYAAGASFVGPSNLLTLLESIPPYWAPLKKRFMKRVGNPEKAKDRKRLKAQSPYFHAGDIEDPLLVIQGANDPRVKKQESDQIVVASHKRGITVEYLVAPEEGHGFDKEDNRLAAAAKIETFFGKHLGGRYQKDINAPIEERLNDIEVDPASVTLPDSTGEKGPSNGQKN